MTVDVLIFGGGGAGLWLCDELHRAGFVVLLVESVALGSGQTVASQGIIHGGLKYAITGSQRESARAIREMPELWRSCIEGDSEPTLRATRVRTDCCYMWRTTSLKSTLGMVGARAGLRSNVEKVAVPERPTVLASCPGDVYRVDEQVIDVVSFIADLAGRHRGKLLHVNGAGAVELVTSAPGRVQVVRLTHPANGEPLELRTEYVVFVAGAGNAELRVKAGLSGEAMQRRALHMVLVRGHLPELYGHCVDGAHTRVTVTSAVDSRGRTVWLVGGQVAEDGVDMGAGELITHAQAELGQALPGVDFSATEWSTYAIDRAEPKTPGGHRPPDAAVLVEGNVITGWPTKLALVPQLAKLIRAHLGSPSQGRALSRDAVDWPSPEIALPPWETPRQWVTPA